MESMGDEKSPDRINDGYEQSPLILGRSDPSDPPRREVHHPGEGKGFFRELSGPIPLFTLVIALTAIGQALVTYYQLSEMRSDGKQTQALQDTADVAKESLNIARKNFALDQRPYIWLTNDLPGPGFMETPSKAPNGQVLWNLQFMNYGRSPAHDVRFTVTTLAGEGAIVRARTIPPLNQFGSPMPPGKVNFSTGVSREVVSRAEFTRLMGLDDALVMFGRFHYTDIAGTPYETTFCLRHLRTGAVSFCAGSEWNSIK
jgi:hypothetical protein